jgi:hypothetical protein
MTRRRRVRDRKRRNKARRRRPWHGLIGIYPAQTTDDGMSIWIAAYT